MAWSWKLGSIKGVEIKVHITLIFMLGWILLSRLNWGMGFEYAISWTIFTIAIFGIVVLHELGHALAARRYGVRTRDITLWPIGGIARLERIPENPRHELVVAAAGPAVNVILALGLWIISAAIISITGSPLYFGAGLIQGLIYANVGLAIFNLLPAFPMDGGRILRGLLALKMDYLKATNIAAQAGKVMAVFFGLIGLFTFRPALIFIGIFIWFSANGEALMAAFKQRSRNSVWTRFHTSNEPSGRRYIKNWNEGVVDADYEEVTNNRRGSMDSFLHVKNWFKGFQSR